jgi:secondary thiamine-phosphate synthase enzyme
MYLLMEIKTFSFSVNSTKREEFIEITKEISELLKKTKIKTGFCKIFVPHTTAGVTINENADMDVQRDIMNLLSSLIPKMQYLHIEGNSDAHLKSTLVGCQSDVLIQDGKLSLGTWQGIYFLDFDGPRNRKVNVMFIGE